MIFYIDDRDLDAAIGFWVRRITFIVLFIILFLYYLKFLNLWLNLFIYWREIGNILLKIDIKVIIIVFDFKE